MTFSYEGAVVSAWPLLVISRRDRSPRVSSVSDAQPFFGSDQATEAGDLQYPRIERKADCASFLTRIENRFPEPVQPREKSALFSSACSHRQGSQACLRLFAGSGC